MCLWKGAWLIHYNEYERPRSAGELGPWATSARGRPRSANPVTLPVTLPIFAGAVYSTVAVHAALWQRKIRDVSFQIFV